MRKNQRENAVISGTSDTLATPETSRISKTIGAPDNLSLWNKDFILICFSNFFMFITFYILSVTLPTFVVEDLNGSQRGIGLVTTVFIIAAVIFRPLAGKWLNEINNRKMMNASLILFAVCSVAYLFIYDYAPLLVLRVIHGSAFGIAATTTAAIAIRLIPKKRKGEGINWSP